MKEKRNLHQKVQQLCDCFASTDPLSEIAKVSEEPDKEEGPLKWVALAMLHRGTAAAEKIKIFRHADGTVAVRAKYRKAPLRSPGAEIGGKALPLALGIRDSSLVLEVTYEKEDSTESVSIKFPG